MKKFLGTTIAIAALAVLGACSSGTETETAPDAGSTVDPAQTETYVEPETGTPEAVEDGSAADKANTEMAPADGTEGAMEAPSNEAPADPSVEAPAEGGASN